MFFTSMRLPMRCFHLRMQNDQRPFLILFWDGRGNQIDQIAIEDSFDNAMRTGRAIEMINPMIDHFTILRGVFCSDEERRVC